MKHSDGQAALKAKTKGKASVLNRFMAKVAPTPNENGCWIWIGAKSGGCGYGAISIDGKAVYAHRASYELFKGPIPKGKMVLHTCDCRECANPAHVYAGTHADNVADAKSRNRYAGKKRLGKAGALKVVALSKTGKTHSEVAAAMSITVEAVASVMQGKCYSKFTGIKAKAAKTKRQTKTTNARKGKAELHMTAN